MKLDIVKVMEQNEPTKVVDEKVIAIELALEKLHNLYKVLTYEICGKTYDVFDNRIVNYKEVLELEGLHFVVKEHGFGKSFFLTYKKPTFLWFSKEKQFYFSQGYSFHVEYKRENRYDFTLEDYSFILDTLNRENEKLQQYIIKVRDFKIEQGILKMNNDLEGLETVTILTRNAIKCLECNTVLESKYRHDFTCCHCPNQASTDGGLVYQRISARDLSKVENLSEHKTYRSEEYQALLDERQQVYEQRMQERVALGEVVKVGNQYYDVKVLKTLVDKCDLVKTILDDVKGEMK